MRLTTSDINALPATGKAYKKADGSGLYVFVSPKGSKLWRMNYRYNARQKTLSFGAFPNV